MNSETLEKYWAEHDKPYEFKYPEQFDPKWVVMESGWPFFKLSALDDQPWKEMYAEAEALSEYFHPHREETYGNGWKSLTLHGLNEDTQTLNSYGERSETIKKLHWTWVADKCPITTKFLTDVWPAEYLNRVRFML